MNPLENFLPWRFRSRRSETASAAVELRRLSETRPTTTEAAAADWWVKVREAPYGPYTGAQLLKFIEEGRVRPNTHVARAKDGPWKEARTHADLFVQPRAEAAQAGGDQSLANLFVYAEIHSGAWMPFMAALETLGRICEVAPGFWLVRTHRSVGVMRNTLSQTLERGDRFVVIDATRDRFAWFNLGPEVDSRIKEVWNAANGARR
ncbi:MAG: DUF4339 domain-containing protein [Hyphomonadaceae bacterium]|nr:DUF4339 domain-containing protein [Hyphomonadaceae bacterium]